MAVTSDSIRERKKKLREEERRNKEKSSQEAASKSAVEEGKKSGPDGKKKNKKNKSPNRADEIRAKNEAKQNKYEEKKAQKEDIASARAEGREQKKKRQSERSAKKSAKQVVKNQEDLATRSVTERPPAAYSDASNPNATPTLMPDGRSLLRDEQNMQYIDTNTGEAYPFGPNETAAMKRIIARRVARKQAGAINQERVGPDGTIRMDQDDAALLAKARKADMQAGSTNTRAKPQGQPTGDLTEVDAPAKDGPQQQDVMPEVDDPMGAPPTPKPPAVNNDAKSVAEGIIQESNRTGKRPSDIIAEMQEQGIALPPGIEKWIPEGGMPDPEAEPEAEAPPAPEAEDDTPPRLRTDGAFPYSERAPEGNAIGGTRFKDQDDFNNFQREENKRKRMRPGGGMQRERDAMDGSPLYSDKSPEEQWAEREVYPENNRTIEKLSPEELEAQKDQIEKDALDPTVTEKRIEQLWNRGEITTEKYNEMMQTLYSDDPNAHMQVKAELKGMGRNKRVRRNQEIEADTDLRQSRVTANAVSRAGNGGLLLQEQLANGTPQEQDAAWSMMVGNGMISEFAPRPDFFGRGGVGMGGGGIPSPNPNDALPTQNSFKRDQIMKYNPMYTSPDDFKGMTQGQLDELFEGVQSTATAQNQQEGVFNSVGDAIAAGKGQDWGFNDYVNDAQKRAQISKGKPLTQEEADAITARVEQQLFRSFAGKQLELNDYIQNAQDKNAAMQEVWIGLPRHIREDLAETFIDALNLEVDTEDAVVRENAIKNYYLQLIQQMSPDAFQLYMTLYPYMQTLYEMPEAQADENASIGGPSFEVGEMDQGPLIA